VLDMLDRAECPECGVGMVVTQGYGRERKKQTFECLQCGCTVRGGKVFRKNRCERSHCWIRSGLGEQLRTRLRELYICERSRRGRSSCSGGISEPPNREAETGPPLIARSTVSRFGWMAESWNGFEISHQTSASIIKSECRSLGTDS